MSFWHTVFWSALIIAFAGLSLLILGLAAVAPKPEPLFIGGAAALPPPGVSTVAKITPPELESPAVRSMLDSSFKIGNYLKITGWLYVADQQTRGQEVYVQLEKPGGEIEHYSALPTERPDVGAAFKNPLYNNAGFSALIPLVDGIDIKACAIRLVVKNSKGIYKGTRLNAAGNKKP